MLKKSLLLFSLLSAFSVHAVELVKWERIPLTVKLNAEQERIIFVNKNVRVGFPPELTNKLRVQSTGGAVYLQANSEFPTARLQLQDVETGEIILLDVTSTTGTKVLEPMSIIYSGDLTTATSADAINYADETSSTESTQSQASSLPTDPIPIALTRYAAQNLYGPIRTVEALPGVSPASVPLPKKITTLLPTENVEVTPLAGWKLRNNHVVALKIVNQGNQKVVLDPRRLHGKFVSAAFQHRFLGENGTPEDTTTVYIVTEGRIDNAFIAEPKKSRKGK